MNILVAGGAGFIGCHLIDALLKEGHHVVCIDNFFIGTKENVKHLKDNPDFIFYELNLDNFFDLQSVFKKEKIEQVFHLAANSDIQASAKNPAIELQNTATTTFNLLECMRLYDVKKLFFASTSAVYGEKIGLKMDENTVPLEPVSYYGSAKLASEAFISAFTHMNDMHSLVFRFPNVIGSRLTHGAVFDFIKKLTKNPEELEILGDGTQCKPYMYVADLVRGIMQLKDVSQGVHTYNIGVETQTTVTRIADIVCECMGLQNVSYKYTGGKIGWKGDVPTFSYDLTKIRSTGWKADKTSDEAVYATVKAVLK